MDQVWAYTINKVGLKVPSVQSRPSYCCTSAEAMKRGLDEIRPEKIQWIELPSGTWVGKFLHHKHGSEMQISVYSIPIIKDE